MEQRMIEVSAKEFNETHLSGTTSAREEFWKAINEDKEFRAALDKLTGMMAAKGLYFEYLSIR